MLEYFKVNYRRYNQQCFSCDNNRLQPSASHLLDGARMLQFTTVPTSPWFPCDNMSSHLSSCLHCHFFTDVLKGNWNIYCTLSLSKERKWKIDLGGLSMSRKIGESIVIICEDYVYIINVQSEVNPFRKKAFPKMAVAWPPISCASL